MNLTIAIPAMLAVGLVIAVFLIIRKTAFSGSALPVTAEWIDELSIERYRPMMRLLDTRDLEFLRAQPGYSPKMAAKLRAQRCQIFRGYLRCLQGDFGRVCAALRILMMQSRLDRPDLARVVVHYQMTFALNVFTVQCRLLLYRWGVCSVDVSSLVNVFDLTRRELRSLVPVAAPMAV